MDYISIWFYKGSEYIKNIEGDLGFVSTNSIVQGELVVLLWPHILSNEVKIKFAYKPFKWSNNAKSKAGVTVVIIGLTSRRSFIRYLYLNNLKTTVKNINAYLVDFKNTYILNRSKPLSRFPKMTYGNLPGGCTELFLTPNEKNELTRKYPELNKYIKRLVGSQESINNIERYCLWFKDLKLNDQILQKTEINSKLEVIKNNRESSKDKSYNDLSDRPHQFRDLNETLENSIVVPIVSSENRKYIPLSIVNSECIVPNSAQVIYDTEMWIFSIVCSQMHMVWMRAVAGRLEERYRYSKNVVYNTFPFSNTREKEELAQNAFKIIGEREKHPEKTLAQLYDPDKMPDGLREAHHQNDLAIERCYRSKPFENDEERLEYLFKLYEKMIAEEEAK